MLSLEGISTIHVHKKTEPNMTLASKSRVDAMVLALRLLATTTDRHITEHQVI